MDNNILKKIRLLAGMSQNDLKNIIGVKTRQGISQYERSLRVPSIDIIKAYAQLASKYGISYQEIIEGLSTKKSGAVFYGKN